MEVMEQVEEAKNKQVIFKGFIEGTPKETDFQVMAWLGILSSRLLKGLELSGQESLPFL